MKFYPFIYVGLLIFQLSPVHGGALDIYRTSLNKRQLLCAGTNSIIRGGAVCALLSFLRKPSLQKKRNIDARITFSHSSLTFRNFLISFSVSALSIMHKYGLLGLAKATIHGVLNMQKFKDFIDIIARTTVAYSLLDWLSNTEESLSPAEIQREPPADPSPTNYEVWALSAAVALASFVQEVEGFA